MKNLYIIFAFLFMASFLFAQDENNMEQGAMDEETKVWMDYMTPGEMHTLLAGGEGEWKTKSTFWMEPGTEPMVTEGTSKGEMILGGRYLRTEHTGNMMGMPFQGISIEGYDKALNKFVNVWIDNFGTGIAYAEGVYNEEEDIFEYNGTMTDPMTKEAMSFRQTVKWNGKDEAVFKMYMPIEGEEFQSMEVIMTR